MPRRRPALAALLVTLHTFAGITFAQTPAASTAPSANDEPAAPLRVYLVTFGPGDEVWEQFGHNAIQITNPATGDDFICNWGVFDFGSDVAGHAKFFGNFILGHLNYQMDVDFDATGVFRAYRASKRSAYRQELNLSPKQKAALYDFVAWNSKRENRYYQYDYYKDNCSTRTRDAIDKAVGGAIREQLAPVPTGTSFRSHTRRIMASDPVLYTALLFILGQPIDRPISAYDESFLPLRLMDHLRRVTITDETGHAVPLIKSEETLFEATRPTQRTGPPNWLLPFFLLGPFCAAVFYALSRLASCKRVARLTLISLATLWAFFVGGAGTFALWGWLFTRHTAVRYNENLFHFFPPTLILTLLPYLLRRPRFIAVVRGLAIATPAASLVGLMLKLLPWFYQTNLELIAWVLPTHVAFAYALFHLTRPKTPRDTLPSDFPLPAQRPAAVRQ